MIRLPKPTDRLVCPQDMVKSYVTYFLKWKNMTNKLKVLWNNRMRDLKA